jgi:hypothetical protein
MLGLIITLLSTFIMKSSSSYFGIYADENCNKVLFKSNVYMNVCMWKENRSFSLLECNNTHIRLNAYNMSSHLKCIGEPLANVSISRDCSPIEGVYVKLIDKTRLVETNECYLN